MDKKKTNDSRFQKVVVILLISWVLSGIFEALGGGIPTSEVFVILSVSEALSS